MSKVEDFIAGASVGALTGLLIGLSTASVVGTAISAIAAILAAVLGLTKAKPEHFEQQRSRIMGFGIFATLALLGGLLLRVQDILAPSISDQINEWKRAGYTEDVARAYAAFERLGIKPDGADIISKPGPLTVLSSSTSSTHCNNLKPGNRTAAQWVSAARAEDAPWPDIADIVESSRAESQADIVNAIWRVLCEV
ncbi:hypothetical protein [Alteromonas sp. H39]|uniref:hypothetical protein n=1 Tax=Alteromonas sp. H39 TaxID=3389876 RepID=UPI0039DF8ED2